MEVNIGRGPRASMPPCFALMQVRLGLAVPFLPSVESHELPFLGTPS